ncbi:MAG: hypothetical protein ACK56I_05595, partial [bacterium]
NTKFVSIAAFEDKEHFYVQWCVRVAFVVLVVQAFFGLALKTVECYLHVDVYILIIPIVLTNPRPCCCLKKYR